MCQPDDCSVSGRQANVATMTTTPTPWTGLVPIEDTALYVRDTGGNGCPVIYLNGSYADQSHWKRVIAELGDDYRHITFDERARGRSKRSADYSFEAALRDIDAVLAARGVERPLVVGWSYGGILSWHWADRNPDRVLGVVCVDAFPIGLTGEAARARIRKLFRRSRLVLPIAARFGLAARMSADRHADINIEINEISVAGGPVIERLTCPVRFVLATGQSLGNEGDEMEQGRAKLDPIIARHPNLKVSAKVASNHSKILLNNSPAIAAAIRELAPATGHPVS